MKPAGMMPILGLGLLLAVSGQAAGDEKTVKPEDLAVIENMDLLENWDVLQDEEVEFLEEYDVAQKSMEDKDEK
ncbi:MAG: hypothetical protein Q8Q08_00495 [Candidatus Omnitrophota bacterium]|nr:hypothetical protein [Candidatus Omnitrophota bacterium]MDZ4242149.1 hypothetical protein [Candidatus Omnitrophota bacterium]